MPLAGVNKFNYFYEMNEQKLTCFAGISFTDAPEILESTAVAPHLFGVSSKTISGLSWEETAQHIQSAVDAGKPIIAGPLDSHYMRMFNEVHLDTFQPRTGYTDHFLAITGYDHHGIYFSDNVGYCNVHMPWDNLRSGLTSPLYFYLAGQGETAHTDSVCRLVVFGSTQREVPLRELLQLGALRISAGFLTGRSFTDNKTTFIYGSDGLYAFARGCQEAFMATDVKTLRTIVTEIYKSRTGAMWGHQLRAWYSYFWHRVATDCIDDFDSSTAIQLRDLFFEASQAWIDFHRTLRQGFDALYDADPVAKFVKVGTELSAKVRTIASAEIAVASLLAPNEDR